jgi:hypothetical protein
VSQYRLPNGLTRKQEHFAQGVASGLSASDAYRQAYDTNGNSLNAVQVAASQLVHHPKVALRLDTLIAEAEVLAQLSRGNVATRLDEDREFARVHKDPKAAIKATELRADMIDAFGKRERRLTAKVTHRVERFRSMEDSELDEFIDSTYKELTNGVDGDDAGDDA